MRRVRLIPIGLLALLLALLGLLPAPLAADHNELSLKLVSDRPLDTIGLRHPLPDHPGPAEQGQLAPPPPPCDKDVDLTGTFAGVVPIAAQDNLICTSSDIDTYVGQDGKTYIVQAGGQEGAWVHTDVSNPSSPVRLAVWIWSGQAGANTYTPDVKAFSQGNRDYIALSLQRLASLAFCGVVIEDVTDPLNPVIVGGQQFIGEGWCDSHNIFVESIGGDGRYIYAVASISDDMRVLEINSDLTACDYDPGTSAPDCLTEIGRYTHPDAGGSNNVHDITVIDHGGSVGRRVYVSYWDAGLMILNAAHVTPGVIEAGSTNQPLNPDYSIDPAGFLTHHAFPSEDGSRVFIEDEITFVAGFEPVQMWTTAPTPAYVDGIELGGSDPADVPFVLPAHNLEVRYDLDLDGDGSPDNRLYVGWYKAGLQAFEYDSGGIIARRMYHQVQTEQQDAASDGAWGVRLATIGADTYVFQSDRRYGLIIDKVDICSVLANPGQTDSDGDGVVNLCDPDDDDDSQGLGDPFGLFFRDGVEVFLGTLPLVACAATPATDDEDPDALGPDWDDSQDIDGSDLFLFAERFGTEFGVPPPIGKQPYIQRFDIYPTAASLNKIDGSDLFVLASYFGDSCP